MHILGTKEGLQYQMRDSSTLCANNNKQIHTSTTAPRNLSARVTVEVLCGAEVAETEAMFVAIGEKGDHGRAGTSESRLPGKHCEVQNRKIRAEFECNVPANVDKRS